MSEIKRWHDENQKLKEMLDVLEKMPEHELNEITRCFYQVVNIYWRQKKTYEENLSIGREKLFSYYKAYQKRRWYDKTPSLSSALNILSTFSSKEIDMIVEGFISALKEYGLYKIYKQREGQVKK